MFEVIGIDNDGFMMEFGRLMVRTTTREYSPPTQGVEVLEEAFEDLSIELEEEDLAETIEAKEEANLSFLVVNPLRDWRFSAFDHMEDQ